MTTSKYIVYMKTQLPPGDPGGPVLARALEQTALHLDVKDHAWLQTHWIKQNTIIESENACELFCRFVFLATSEFLTSDTGTEIINTLWRQIKFKTYNAMVNDMAIFTRAFRNSMTIHIATEITIPLLPTSGDVEALILYLKTYTLPPINEHERQQIVDVQWHVQAIVCSIKITALLGRTDAEIINMSENIIRQALLDYCRQDPRQYDFIATYLQ